MSILPFISKGKHFQKGGDVKKAKVLGREILSKVEVWSHSLHSGVTDLPLGTEVVSFIVGQGRRGT